MVNGIGDSLEKVVIVPFCSNDVQENQLKGWLPPKGKEILLKTFLDEAKGNTFIEYEQVIFLLFFLIHTYHSLIRGVLIQSCPARAKNFTIHNSVVLSKILKMVVPF